MLRSTLALAALISCGLPTVSHAQTVLGGTVFTVQELVGVGRLPANLRDEHGETFGSISGLWGDAASWGIGKSNALFCSPGPPARLSITH